MSRQGELTESTRATLTRVEVLGERGSPPRRADVVLSEVRCMVRTVLLLVIGKIGMPRSERGRVVSFGDGSSSRIYRETKMRPGRSARAVLVVVRFRLKWVGANRLAHSVFRVESLLNTILFAAHPGFSTKLWLTDPCSGFYRGIYEWEGVDAAFSYAEVLRVVLMPWVERGSFGYRVIGGVDRADFLDGSVAVDEDADPATLWWLPVNSAGDGDRSDA